jgi:antitoxin (DNA-binding transcriptional repressor) of toxin-antitoxin stability system
MKTYALNQNLPPLATLIAELKLDQEIVLTEHEQPVAKLVFVASPARPHPKAGTLKGNIWMSPDFDEPLEDFKEYME